MKKTFLHTLCALLVLCLLPLPALALEFTDANGRNVEVAENPQRVVALYGSYGDAWLTAGGALAGITEDMLRGNDPRLGPEVQNVGTHTTPNVEVLLSLEPDFVLLSADVAGQAELAEVLDDAGIPCALFSTKDYRSYMDMISVFTRLTGREDLYAEQVETVQAPIEEMIGEAQADARYGVRTALLLRAFSSGVKAKGSGDTVAGVVLRDMGFVNIADGDSALSENLSLEAILMADPDYVFVVTMGTSSEAAMDAMAELLTGNPAWAGLRAVQEDRYVVLDSKLFHYHPNRRWAESYAVIRNLIAAEGAAQGSAAARSYSSRCSR